MKDIRAVLDTIAPHILRTPLVELGRHATAAGHPILLKAECLQPTGSFKVRGATYKVSQRTGEESVVAYSTGNHAQAVARAAAMAGLPATIVMSTDTPAAKISATERWGAEIILVEPSSAARRAAAERLAEERKALLVPPYDDLDVIAGQATIGLEIAEEVEAAAIFVPIGGGGLLSGIAYAIKNLTADVRVIGVEPELENDAWQSFHAGELRTLPGPSDSSADAIKVQRIGDLTYPMIRDLADDVVTVSESDIAAAQHLCATEAHLVVEPSGAVGVAAALAYAGSRDTGRPVVAIASGGNG